MSENKNELDNKASNNEGKANIFTNFNTDTSLDIEIENLKKQQSKDLFYYLSLNIKLFEVLVVLGFLVLGVFYSYVYIQKNENFYNKEYLKPVCSFFNGDIDIDGNGCSSISYNKKLIDDKIKTTSEQQLEKIFSLLPIIYEKENFIKTKEISFLLDKSQNKAKVLDVLNKFNYFKNEFTGFEKKKIDCKDFNIDFKNRTLSAKCFSHSAGYSEDIIGFSGNKNIKEEYISGTSISIANSFVNFLEKNAGKYFLVINKQKTFTSEDDIGGNGYTNKTSFDINLKINF